MPKPKDAELNTQLDKEGDDKDKSRDNAEDNNSGKSAKLEEKSGDIFITLPGDSPKEEDDDEPAERPPETAETRRRNRYREQIERATAAEVRSRQLEEENRALREMQLHALRQQPFAQPSAQTADPLDTEIKSTQAQRRRLFDVYTLAVQNRALQPGDQERYIEESEALEEKMQGLRIKKHLRDNTPRVDPQVEEFNYVRNSNPDVFGNPRAVMTLQSIYYRKRAQDRPDSRETLEEAIDETRKELRLGPYRNMPVSQNTKEKYTGVPRGMGTNANEAQPVQIKMDKHMRKMADAAFPHIKDQNKRYQQWANTAGREVIRDMMKEKEARD